MNTNLPHNGLGREGDCQESRDNAHQERIRQYLCDYRHDIYQTALQQAKARRIAIHKLLQPTRVTTHHTQPTASTTKQLTPNNRYYLSNTNTKPAPITPIQAT